VICSKKVRCPSKIKVASAVGCSERGISYIIQLFKSMRINSVLETERIVILWSTVSKAADRSRRQRHEIFVSLWH